MSIFASLAAPDDSEHEDGCAVYVETEPGSFEFSGLPCDCGQPDAPLIYQGSHVLPSDTDKRDGAVDIALIPHFVRANRENPDASPFEADGPPEPFLRFGVNEGTVILTERNVRQIRDTLDEWLSELSKAPVAFHNVAGGDS